MKLRINDRSHISAELLSEIIGISQRQIQELDRAGIFTQTAHGKYDLGSSVRAWSEYLLNLKINGNRFHYSMMRMEYLDSIRRNGTNYNNESILNRETNGEVIKTKDIPIGHDVINNDKVIQKKYLSRFIREINTENKLQNKKKSLAIKDENINGKNPSHVELITPLGVSAFDKKMGGLDRNVFNIVEAGNINIAIATLGHFIQKGLNNNERVVIVSLENPKHLFSKLERYGFHFESYLENEQLIYLYYKPNYAHALHLSTNYQFLINEILSLAGSSIGRVAFDNTDVLFNLQSLFLARASAAKILAATGNVKCTMLGIYVSSQSEDIEHLKAASKALIPSYLRIKKISGQSSRSYSFVWEKSLLQRPDGELYVQLKEGYGFVEESEYSN